MRAAIISVTNKGAELAEKIAPFLSGEIDLYAKEERNPRSHNAYSSLSDLVKELFPKYDGLIFIMATGIVVRMIAPYVRDKRLDPAVVVMDDGGTFAISLLSGHIGGANDLAELVSIAAGATPVITTATDVANLPAADVIAVKLNLTIEPFPALKTINSAIVNGEKVRFFLDEELIGHDHYHDMADEQGVELEDLGKLATEDYDAAVIITDKKLDIEKPHLYLRPGSLAVGVGCRRDAASAEIMSAISQACQAIGRSTKSIAVIGSTVLKEDEIGLLATGQHMAVPVRFFSNEQLEECIEQHGLALSNFVKEKIGVGNICEPAAILAGKNSKLLLPKTKYPKVTVAITPANYRWWE